MAVANGRPIEADEDVHQAKCRSVRCVEPTHLVVIPRSITQPTTPRNAASSAARVTAHPMPAETAGDITAANATPRPVPATAGAIRAGCSPKSSACGAMSEPGCGASHRRAGRGSGRGRKPAGSAEQRGPPPPRRPSRHARTRPRHNRFRTLIAHERRDGSA